MLPYLLASLFLVAPSPVLTVPIAEAAIVYDFNSTSTVADYVANQAIQFDVPVNRALYISKNESSFIATTTGDMELKCRVGVNKGKPVRARGIFQITDCYHPEVTDQEAFSVEWSTRWAMERMRDDATCRKEWTTCRVYLGKDGT